jgi:hypothetical protein
MHPNRRRRANATISSCSSAWCTAPALDPVCRLPAYYTHKLLGWATSAPFSFAHQMCNQPPNPHVEPDPNVLKGNALPSCLANEWSPSVVLYVHEPLTSLWFLSLEGQDLMGNRFVPAVLFLSRRISFPVSSGIA